MAVPFLFVWFVDAPAGSAIASESEAIQSLSAAAVWIASSQELLAMTGMELGVLASGSRKVRRAD